MNSIVWMFSGGNQSVLSATVSADPSHGGEEEGEERSVSVVVENELGNSSEIVVVLQSEAEWVGWVFYCLQLVYCSLAGLHVHCHRLTCSVSSLLHLRSSCVSE